MSEIYDSWDKEEFKAFLMIHLANADLEVSDDELLVIMDHISDITYRKVKRVWDNCNDFECLQIIQRLRSKHYPGEEGKTSLINGMIEFSKVDNKVSTNEKIMIAAMNKLL